MSDHQSPVQPGDLLAGKYRVDRVLGSGGMGVVVSATHVDLGQLVALKFLLPHAVENPETVTRFLREARAAVKIESEHVARVLDVGRLESGAPYLVMEFLQGRDLSEVPKGAALPTETAVDYVLQACEAMAVAHTNGIVHRDLKPANLFLTMRPDGAPNVKVLDFGISKISEAGPARKDLTQTSAIMGSPLYMSPEQMRSSRNVDQRTDIWSLGAILYELLSGEPPFNGESLGEVFAAVIGAEPAALRSKRSDVPAGLEQVVHRALAKDLTMRYQNVGELAQALAPFAPDTARALVDRASGVLSRAGVVIARPAASVAAPSPAGAQTDTAWTDTGARRPAANRRPLFFVAAVLALGMGFGSAVLLFRHRTPDAASEPSAEAQVAAAPSLGAALATSVAERQAPPGPSASASPAAPSAAATPLIAEAAVPANEISTNVARPKPTQSTKPATLATPVATTARSTPPVKKNPLNLDFK